MSVASDLLTDYQHVIDELTFVTGDKGVFDVVVDGETIFSKHRSGRHAEPGEVLEVFAERFARGIDRYGT